MDEQILIAFIAVVVVGTIIILSSFYNKKAIIKRKLKKATGKKISTFVTGDIAKVVGKVECIGEPLTAPLSGRRCAHYTVLVEEKVSTGKSSHWKTLVEEEVAGKFVIRDGRYVAYIDSQIVRSYIVEDRQYKSGFGEDATAVLEQYLNAHGQKSEGVFGWNKTLRYKEGVLEEGELIAVIGRGEWKNSENLNLPDTYDRVLVLKSTEKEPVYLSDDPDTVKITYDDSYM